LGLDHPFSEDERSENARDSDVDEDVKSNQGDLLKSKTNKLLGRKQQLNVKKAHTNLLNIPKPGHPDIVSATSTKRATIGDNERNKEETIEV